MPTNETPDGRRLKLAEAFLHDAANELELFRKTREEVNLRQACEKGWGATAQLLMLAAGKEITEHRGFSEAATELYKKTGKREILLIHAAAEGMHAAGFYHGALTAETVEATLASIKDLMSIITTPQG